MKRIVFAFAALSWLVALAAPASAAEIEGVTFEERTTVDEIPFVLNGVGLLRYKIIFKGYVAGLYLGEGVTVDEIFEDVPKRLEIEYFWSIGGKRFGPAGDEILAKNVSADTMSALAPSLEAINRLYPDVSPGDRLALTYLPGKGTTLAKNGKALGTVEDEQLGKDYLRLWLGREPMNEALRDALLDRE